MNSIFNQINFFDILKPISASYISISFGLFSFSLKYVFDYYIFKQLKEIGQLHLLTTD